MNVEDHWGRVLNSQGPARNYETSPGSSESVDSMVSKLVVAGRIPNQTRRGKKCVAEALVEKAWQVAIRDRNPRILPGQPAGSA